MKRLIQFLFGLTVLLTTSLDAQINWQEPILQITENDGLPSTYYKDFEEDEFGFVWIATYSGLCRFDGSRLECLQNRLLPRDGYIDIEYDAKQKCLWIGTHAGLFSYHLLSGEVKAYKHNSSFDEKHILGIALDADDQVWVGMRTSLEVLRVGADSLETIEINVLQDQEQNRGFNEIFCITPDPVHDHYLWLSTEGGIVRYDKVRQGTKWIGEKEEKYWMSRVNEIHADANSDCLYFGLQNHGTRKEEVNYMVYNVRKEKIEKPISFNIDFQNRKINNFQDSLLLMSTSKGLIFYNQKAGQISKVLEEEPNAEISYKVDFVDSKGNIWSGRPDGIQVYSVDKPRGKTYAYSSAFPNWYHVVTDLFFEEISNQLYLTVFGGEGLYEFDLNKDQWAIYPLRSEEDNRILKTDFMKSFVAAEDTIGVLANSGYYEWTAGGQVKKMELGLDSIRTWGRSLIDSENHIWMLGNGFVKANLKTKKIERLKETLHFCELYSGTVFFYEDSQSNIWFGGLCNGFDLYDRAKDVFHSFELEDYASGDVVTSFSEKDGAIWALSETGDIMVFDVAQAEKGAQKVIHLSQGVKDGSIRLINSYEFEIGGCIAGNFDRLGHYWFITKSGLYRYKEEEQELELFDKELGLDVNDPEMNVFVADNLTLLPDGRFVFSKRKSICFFDPERIQNQTEIPQPYITSVLANNESYAADSSSLFKTNYHFRPNENFISFDFSAISFSDPDKLEFRYKMEGIDEDWKDPGDKRFVSYTQMRGGDYVFKLTTLNAFGDLNEKMARIELSVANYWYNMLWVRLLFVAALIAGIVSFYYSKLNRAIKAEHLKTQYEKNLAELKMKALTAQMNPHFIFNSLNSIDYYIIKNDTRKASRYLNRFSRLMRLILKNSRSNYISLKDDLDALKLYLEIESLRFNHQFEYEIDVAEDVDQEYIRIPPMLIQPYVENSIWHGLLHKRKDGKIIIRLEQNEEQDLLKCIVRDNGIGREKSMELKGVNGGEEERKSFGMNITRDKIEAINYLHGIHTEVKITDLHNEDYQSIGTMVEIQIPV